MARFILTAYEMRRTEISSFAAMKEDWEKLSFNQQIGCISRLLTGIVLSNDARDKFARFVRTINMPEFTLGNTKILRIDHGNMYEFSLIETVEKAPVMEEVSDEDYQRFIEDADNEQNK